MKNGWNKGRDGEKNKKDLERGLGAVFLLFRCSNLGRFLFLCRSKSVSAPFQNRSCPFLVLLTYHIQKRATSSPIIGPRRTITGPRDQWEVCVRGDETLGTSSRNMSAPACGSKRSSSITKVRALGAPHTKRKRRINGPD